MSSPNQRSDIQLDQSAPNLTHVYMTLSLPRNTRSVLQQPVLSQLETYRPRHSRRGERGRHYQLHIPVVNSGSSINQQHFRVHSRSVEQVVTSNQHYTNNSLMNISGRRRRVQRIEIDVAGLSATESDEGSPHRSPSRSPPSLLPANIPLPLSSPLPSA